MDGKGIRWLLFLATFLASSTVAVSQESGSALALGSNPYWDSWGNCNNYIPHGWSSTWWNYYPSNSWGGVSAYLEWQDSGGSWHIEMAPPGQTASGTGNTVTIDNYWGATARGSWLEIATHSGSMSPLTGGGQSSQKSIWCG